MALKNKEATQNLKNIETVKNDIKFEKLQEVVDNLAGPSTLEFTLDSAKRKAT